MKFTKFQHETRWIRPLSIETTKNKNLQEWLWAICFKEIITFLTTIFLRVFTKPTWRWLIRKRQGGCKFVCVWWKKPRRQFTCTFQLDVAPYRSSPQFFFFVTPRHRNVAEYETKRYQKVSLCRSSPHFPHSRLFKKFLVYVFLYLAFKRKLDRI